VREIIVQFRLFLLPLFSTLIQSKYQQLSFIKAKTKTKIIHPKLHTYFAHVPKYETYELGSQIRRSADSVNSNIVEGYGRKQYKNDFIRFLIYAYSSNDETINYLKKIELLYPELSNEVQQFIQEYDLLGKKINKFIAYVKSKWRT